MQLTFHPSLSEMIYRSLSALERAVWRYLGLLGRKFRVQSMNIGHWPARSLKRAVLSA
jgi:hypothetical protein